MMIAYEFSTRLTDNGTLIIPPEYQRTLRTGAPVRVLLLVAENGLAPDNQSTQANKQHGESEPSSLEEIVASIQRMGPNPKNITPASGLLAQHLMELVDEADPTFDSEQWLREWERLEAQLVTILHPLRDKILTALDNGDVFAIPSPVLNEFLRGIRSLPRAQQNLHIWDKIRADFIYHAVDAADAEQAVDLRIHRMRQGRQLGVMDSFVAVVALRYDLILLTTAKDFDPIPNLKQENWLRQ